MPIVCATHQRRARKAIKMIESSLGWIYIIIYDDTPIYNRRTHLKSLLRSNNIHFLIEEKKGRHNNKDRNCRHSYGLFRQHNLQQQDSNHQFDPEDQFDDDNSNTCMSI